MKLSSHFLKSIGFVLVCNLSTAAFGVTQQERCYERDFLDAANDNAKAKGRIAWAKKCQFFNSNKAGAFSDLQFYPSFIKNDGSFDAPVDPSASCEGWTAHYILCPWGCYTPEQRVLFSNRYVKIKDAVSSEETVTGLTSDSTLDKLTYGEHPLDAFILGKTKETVYTFKTESGKSLQVTGIHPMITGDGFVMKAKDVKEGMTLLTAEGEKDLVANLSTEWFEGTVYNFRPVSENKMENIHVAEGLLTGSNRFQNQWIDSEFRIRLRREINVDGL